MPTPSQNTPIACDLGAIAPDLRADHMATADNLFASVLHIQETPQGYRFQLPLNPPTIYKAASFINNERLCCSFFTFTLTVSDTLWLELSGSNDVKTYIHDNIVKSVRETGKLDERLKQQVIASVTAHENN